MAQSLGFLGPSGTYTEEACILYDSSAELRPYPTITAVGEAVAEPLLPTYPRIDVARHRPPFHGAGQHAAFGTGERLLPAP